MIVFGFFNPFYSPCLPEKKPKGRSKKCLFLAWIFAPVFAAKKAQAL